MEIQELTVAEEKQKVVRQILEGLPEWFGIAEAREEYIAQSAGQPSGRQTVRKRRDSDEQCE
mgnify:CR=1 FL=1